MISTDDIRLSEVLRYLRPDVGFALNGSIITIWESDSPPPTAPEIDAARLILRRNRLHAARRAARTNAETGGFVFADHAVDSDRDSILRIGNAATTALTASISQAPFATVWTCADEYQMELDAAGVMALQAALSAHGIACHLRSQELKALIDAPDADLDAVGLLIDTGWPLGSTT